MTNPFVWLLDRLADLIGPALDVEFSEEDE